MPNDERPRNHVQLWTTIGKAAIPFIAGIASTAFLLGGRSQKAASNQQDILLWKAEVAPQIQRMDAKGTVAGERYTLEQAKELGRIEERMKELEKESKQIEAMKLKIEGLERASQIRTPTR